MSELVLVARLDVDDPEQALRYAAEVEPVMAAHGGRILGVSTRGREVLEGDWAEYAPLKRLHHECCGSRIVVFEARAPGV